MVQVDRSLLLSKLSGGPVLLAATVGRQVARRHDRRPHRTNINHRCRSGEDHAMQWVLLAALLSLGDCGLVALPFRVAGDVIQVVPVIGKPIGAPVHAIGYAID